MSNLSHTNIPHASLLESLRKNNPFASHMAADPWINNFPDIASINRQAFEEIRILIERKATAPQVPLAGLILGEAGAGKTHLMRRILLACQKSKSPSLFVFVKPLVDSKRPFHLLLQEIVHSLSKKSEREENFSQLERLIAEIIRDYVRHRVTTDPRCATPNNQSFLEKFEANIFHVYDVEKARAGVMEEIISDRVSPVSLEIIEQNAVRYIHSQVPETSKQFLEVVFQYKTPEKRGLVRDWLQGKPFNDSDCEILGVHPKTEISDESREQESREMVLTLGALFARYHLPMVICFDQLDNLVKPELIAGFASMIHLLVNDATSMLPLAFILADSWNERFRNSPDRAFLDRMDSNKFVLKGCNHDEAKELVSRRIEQIFGEGTKETTAIEQWLLPLLESKLSGRGLNSPREVIREAYEIIREASGDSQPKLLTASESLAAEYKSAYEAVAADFDAWDPDSEYLKRAAELFLTNQDDVLSCVPGNDKYMTWTGTLKPWDDALNGEAVPFACFINTSKFWQTVQATLDRCLTFLKNNPGAFCTYVTDARCNFSPTWKATIARREEFESLGGNVVILDQPAAVRWYGLVSLSWKIGSGDILLEDSHGLRTATDKDLASFLKMEFPACETQAFDQITKKKVGPPVKSVTDVTQSPPENLIPAILDILAECTFPVQKTEIILAKLHEKGFHVTLEYCLEQIGKNQDVISLLPTRDGFMVKPVV